MKIRFAAVLYAVLALALALFAGTALAGGHGQGGGGSQAAEHSQSSSHDQQTSSSTSSGDNSTGVKPSSKTNKDPGHNSSAPASSDKTKKYGNGKTAGQIATQAGYGDATLHGPGNSQPHKTNCGGRHDVDVHALKHKSCSSQESQKPEQPKQPEHSQQSSEHKVTICHATGSATNPFVEITVSENALKNGHTTAKGDIIPAPAGGCPAAQTQSATHTEQEQQAQAANCTTTKTETETEVLGVEHSIGPKGSHRSVLIHPSTHSVHFQNKHPDTVVTQSEAKTVDVPASDCTTLSSTQSSTAVQTQSATQSSTQSSSSAPATSSAAPAGSVLGATSPILSSTKAKKAKPAGGVLGATARLGRTVGATNLPFTGLKLWLFALIALALVGIGLLARRASAQR